MRPEGQFQIDRGAWSLVVGYDFKQWLLGAGYQHGWLSVGFGCFGVGFGRL